MKRYGNLFDKITDIDNLILADAKAQHGRVSPAIVKFNQDRDGNILKLQHALRGGTFKTSKYNIFTIFEHKERIIYSLPHVDRIVHHAIMNVLEPIFRKSFTLNTFACISGRGITACARFVRKTINHYHDAPRLYCLKIDIKKFYPNIDHDVMKTTIRRKIKCKRTLQLLDEIIDSAAGLPIGNYTSQILSNLYLCNFMHYVNERIKVKAAQYADDIIFIHPDKARLHEVFAQIKEYINNNLKLTIKSNYQIFPIADSRQDRSGRALDYVGFCFYRHCTLLRRRIKQNFCRRVARLRKCETLSKKELKRQVAPWLGWLKYSDSKHLLKSQISLHYDSNNILRPATRRA